jgi:G3E family GTPase
LDEQLLQGDVRTPGEVHIRQVPGGCLCCVAGVPFQVALIDLIRRARPDRILIEPTGLGHPAALLSTLSSGYFRDLLDLRATITVIDARQMADKRYRDHPIYLDQLTVADVIVANKTDTYDATDFWQLSTRVRSLTGAGKRLLFVQRGQVPESVLDEPARLQEPRQDDTARPVPPATVWMPLQPVFPPEGVIRKSGHQDDFYSLGWLVHPARLFDSKRLLAWLKSLSLLRIKAVVITAGGIVSVNGVPGTLQLGSVDEVNCSRLELLDNQALPEEPLQEALLQCLLT